MDLSTISTADLLREAAGREDIRDKDGVLSYEAFDLIRRLSPLLAVDGIPIRMNETKGLEVGFIRRNTGFYKGRLWSIGGRVLVGETPHTALRRAFKRDLGVEIVFVTGKPSAVGTYVRDLDLAEELGVGHCPDYQTSPPIFLVWMKSEKMVFGSTAHGGQEAGGFEWFPVDQLPPEEEFGYRGYQFVREAIRTAPVDWHRQFDY